MIHVAEHELMGPLADTPGEAIELLMAKAKGMKGWMISSTIILFERTDGFVASATVSTGVYSDP